MLKINNRLEERRYLQIMFASGCKSIKQNLTWLLKNK